MSKTGAQGAGNDDKNALEWTVFIISLLLVMSILSYLGYQVYMEKEETPNLYVELSFDPSEYNQYRYLVSVYNKGGQTAETVTVVVAMKKDGQEVEKAELQLPFVPKESKREGWVNFAKSTAQADTVEAHVVSFKKP